MATDNIPPGDEFIISTGGNPLKIKVGVPKNKAYRISVNQESVQEIE